MSGFVYVILAEESGRVKIGHSAAPERRRQQLQQATHETLTILGTVPASKFDERALHRHLSSIRVRGEWYTDVESVHAVIGAALEKHEAARAKRRAARLAVPLGGDAR